MIEQPMNRFKTESSEIEELLRLFSTPRPNGSAALRSVYAQVIDWLSVRNIPFREHTFRLFPLFWQGIGVWLILSRTLLILAIWFGWDQWTLLIAIISLMGGLLDVTVDFPLASWFWSTKGKNLLIEHAPPAPLQEIILSAHYDTKTELLDHHQRMFFVRNLPTGIVLTILLGLVGPLQQTAASFRASLLLVEALRWSSVILGVWVLILAWGLGANLILGFLRTPSQGAVDNGAACVILLGVADHYARNPSALQRTRLTLALFGGEEINMQGSRAYLRTRLAQSHSAREQAESSMHPPEMKAERVIALNLEVMAQNGEYVVWESDGISLKLWPNAEDVIRSISAAVKQETGAGPLRAGPINSDGGSFLRAGIPATTLGTYDRTWRDRGFHSKADNLQRVVPERISEAERILLCFIEAYDKESPAYL